MYLAAAVPSLHKLMIVYDGNDQENELNMKYFIFDAPNRLMNQLRIC